MRALGWCTSTRSGSHTTWAAPSTRCWSRDRWREAFTWASARLSWRSRRFARASTSGRRCSSTSPPPSSTCPRSRPSSSRRSTLRARTAPRKRGRVRSCLSPPQSARRFMTRSEFGSTRCRSRPRRSSRRCGGEQKANRRAMARRDSQPSPIRRPSGSNRRPRTWTVLRLPRFKYLRPKTAREAARMAADLGPHAMFVAGGTDLFPKLKRRQFEVDALIGLDFLSHAIHRGEDETVVDAGVTLAAASADLDLRSGYPGYAEAAGLVSSPPLRNAGTIGGNLCVDTRCNYYDMTYEWRKAAGFCIKKDGDICLVAPSSPRCWAVSSSDTAPMAIALGALVTLAGPEGERELPVAALYRDDGIDYLAKQPAEVVTSLRLPAAGGTRTAYVKLRRRGSIDFPIAGAAVALRLDGSTVTSCRIVLSAVASHPLEADEASEFMVGKQGDEESIRAAAEIAGRPAKPLDNADLSHFWRKRMVRVIVEQAFRSAIDQ